MDKRIEAMLQHALAHPVDHSPEARVKRVEANKEGVVDPF